MRKNLRSSPKTGPNEEREHPATLAAGRKGCRMRRTRYTKEQIAFTLRQAETGTLVGEVIRNMGISKQTFYRWEKQHGQMGGNFRSSFDCATFRSTGYSFDAALRTSHRRTSDF